MILEVLAMAFAQVEAAPPSEDIVVAAERLKRFRAVTRKDSKTGKMRCIVKRRSGDPALDAGVCAALLDCTPKVKTVADMRACMTPAMAALVPNMPWRATENR